MTTRYLHGNHDPCPACALRREMQDTAPIDREPLPCNVCKGVGYLRLRDAEIVRRTLEEARRLYWPAYYARTGLSEDIRTPVLTLPSAPDIQLLLPIMPQPGVM